MSGERLPARRRRRLTNVEVVRDRLRDRIVSGAYAPGERLPPETPLADEFEVSRTTLREAVRVLVEEGYLSRRQGDGTYVTHRPKVRNNLSVNFGATYLIESMGMKPGSTNVQLTRDTADEEVSEALGIRPGADVFRLERVRTADTVPLVYSIEYLPAWLLGESFGPERVSGSLYSALEQAGIAIHHGVAHLTATTASRRRAAQLLVRVGVPLLLLTQVDYTEADLACLYAREWYVASLVDLQVYRNGQKLRPTQQG